MILRVHDLKFSFTHFYFFAKEKFSSETNVLSRLQFWYGFNRLSHFESSLSITVRRHSLNYSAIICTSFKGSLCGTFQFVCLFKHSCVFLFWSERARCRPKIASVVWPSLVRGYSHNWPDWTKCKDRSLKHHRQIVAHFLSSSKS